MAYVMPNSTILLLSGVPLDREGRHTILFSNPQQQENYFRGFAIKTLEEYSYQRKNLGEISVEGAYTTVMRSNYVMFRNTSYENKWFYAFVDRVDYINDNLSRVYYTMDVMQTWLLEHELRTSFIERQHSETDEIGDNLQPEPVEPGEMMPESPALMQSTTLYYVISVGEQNEQSIYNEYTARTYDKVPTGSTLRVFNSSDAIGISNFLRQGADSAKNTLIAAVNGVYTIPSFILPAGVTVPMGGVNLSSGSTAGYTEVSFSKLDGTEGFGSYMPKNKKLYTYPYTYVDITANAGTSMPLRYEFFVGDEMRFRLYGTLLRPVQVVCKPINYGAYKNYLLFQESVVEGLSLSSFPQGQWTSGGYAEWQAQNSVPQFANVLAGTVGSVVTGNPAQAAAGVLGSITGALMQDYQASFMLPSVRGTLNGGGANVSHGVQNFYISRMRCHSQKAKVIDDFFTAYGYAQNIVAVPNRHARSAYTYVKTVGCNIVGRVPQDDLEKIRSIYDAGVTFWQPTVAICDYSVDNTPLGTVASLSEEVEGNVSEENA